MDLNLLYSDHQIALMRAGRATSLPAFRHHLDRARDIACRIGGYQETLGAMAGRSWAAKCRANPLPAASL